MAATLPAENLDPLSLRGAGLRVTAPRLAVLAAVREGDHRSGAAVTDVGCAVGHAPRLEPDGYDVEEAEVIYWALCAACHADRDQPQPRKESPR